MRLFIFGRWYDAASPSIPARIAVTAEDRFIDIEIKLGEQENLVDTLNRTIYEQGRRIDQLEALVAKLAEHLRALRDAGQGPLNEKPPHY